MANNEVYHNLLTLSTLLSIYYRLRICYNCVINKYLRGYDRKLDLSDWQSRVAECNSIVRKVERDWKMVSTFFSTTVSVCLPVSLPSCLCLSVCLPVCPPACLSVYLSVCLILSSCNCSTIGNTYRETCMKQTPTGSSLVFA